MKILVTGARGTIGRPLVAVLRHQGHDVLAADIGHSDDPGHRRCDVTEYRQVAILWDRMLDGTFDVCFHLAAEFGRINGEEYYEQVWKTNAIGTRHIIEACNRYGTRLVFASSSEIYGDTYGDDLLTEDIVDTKAPRHQNDYAISKWVNEEQIRRLMGPGDYAILRFFNSYGPGEYYTPYRSVVSLFCYRLLTGQPINVYEGYTRAFMYMTDFIPTLANAADLDRKHWGEVTNIGGEEVRPVADLAEIALKETGADPALVTYLPEEAHNTRDKRPSNVHAKNWLDHKPTMTLEQGVRETVKWMRKEYGL